MEIETISEGANSFEFLIKGMRHTFPNLLKEALLKDAQVEFAAYALNHPFDKDAKFIVRTKGKKPKKALEDALKLIDTQMGDFKKAVASFK